MFKGTLVGNLGADAEVKNESGSQFVSFKVADSRKWQDANGTNHEETTWVSCTINGDGGKVLPYLRKGAKVLVIGRMSFNVYSSRVDRCMKAGVKMFVESIELLGGQVEDVPRQLVRDDGLILDVAKWYTVPQDAAHPVTELQDTKGRIYHVEPNGVVTPVKDEQPQGEEQQSGYQGF